MAKVWLWLVSWFWEDVHFLIYVKKWTEETYQGSPLGSPLPDAFLRCVGDFYFTIQNALGAYTKPQGLCVFFFAELCFLRKIWLNRFPLAILWAKILIVFPVESKTNNLSIPHALKFLKGSARGDFCKSPPSLKSVKVFWREGYGERNFLQKVPLPA